MLPNCLSQFSLISTQKSEKAKKPERRRSCRGIKKYIEKISHISDNRIIILGKKHRRRGGAEEFHGKHEI
jgi:hypothetical protein